MQKDFQITGPSDSHWNCFLTLITPTFEKDINFPVYLSIVSVLITREAFLSFDNFIELEHM